MARRSAFLTIALGAFATMTLAGLILVAVMASGGPNGLGFGDGIALVRVDGVIADDGVILEDLRRFRRDASVKGYVVAINSPGGAVGPSQSVYRELRRLRDEDGMPVVASIGAMGASGGYYIALAADTIMALPGSVTGSIGVIMEFPNVSELMDRVGVDMDVVKSSEQKDMGSPFRPMSERDRELLRSVVDDVYEQFVDVVVEERGLTDAEVRSVADGRVLSGRQALERGLIDRLGNMHDAMDVAGGMAGLGPDPRVVRPPADRGITLLDLLLEGRGVDELLRALRAPLERVRWPSLSFIIH